MCQFAVVFIHSSKLTYFHEIFCDFYKHKFYQLWYPFSIMLTVNCLLNSTDLGVFVSMLFMATPKYPAKYCEK
jgi:hypothetical protein